MTQARPTVVIRPVAVSDRIQARHRPGGGQQCPAPRPRDRRHADVRPRRRWRSIRLLDAIQPDVEGIADGQRITRRDLPRCRYVSPGRGGRRRCPCRDQWGDGAALDGGDDLVGPEVLREVIVEGSNELVVSQPGGSGSAGRRSSGVHVRPGRAGADGARRRPGPDGRTANGAARPRRLCHRR